MIEVLANALALFLCWLFGRAALHKFRAPAQYRQLVSDFLGGMRNALPLVYLLATVELALALAVIPPTTRSPGLVGAGLLLSGYAVLMAWHYARGHGDLRCGCSGASSLLTVGPALVVRNLLCSAAALLSTTAPGAYPRGPLAIVSAVAICLLLVAAYQVSDELIAQSQAMEEDI